MIWDTELFKKKVYHVRSFNYNISYQIQPCIQTVNFKNLLSIHKSCLRFFIKPTPSIRDRSNISRNLRVFLRCGRYSVCPSLETNRHCPLMTQTLWWTMHEPWRLEIISTRKGYPYDFSKVFELKLFRHIIGLHCRCGPTKVIGYRRKNMPHRSLMRHWF